MKTLSERLKSALAANNATQAALAFACNVSPPSVNDWLSGKTRALKAATAYRAAAFLGVNLLWLTEGIGPMTPSPGETGSSVSATAISLSRVPLISWVQAGDFSEVVDSDHPGDAETWIETTAPVKAHTFALRVMGDSMEPDFPAGMILVVEPDMDPLPGDFVIAKNGDDATFKKLTKDGADWYLTPLNPRYPIKPLGHSRIIGVVREAVRKFR